MLGEAANILTFLMPVILPVAGMVLIGRALVHIGFLDDPAVRGLSNLVFWLLLPSFLFLSVYKNPIPNAGETIGLYFSIALPAYAVSAAVGRRLLRLTMAQSGVLALNAIYGNSVLLGIPIVGTVWGGPGLNVLLAIVAVHSLLLLPIASAMVEVGERLENPIVGPILSALKNPIVTSILVAVVVRWIEIPIPTAVSRTLELLGQGAPSLSLLCLGATLPPFRRHAFQASVATALVIKLALLPIAMAGAVWLMGVPTPASAVMILTAGLPTGANAFLLARRADTMSEASATTVVLATFFSIVTLSIALSLLTMTVP